MSSQPIEVSERRVRYEPAELIDRFRVLLANFAATFGEREMTEIMGADLLEPLRQGEQEISARLDDEFTIVVIGDFKRGKSTLINALVGEPLLATDAAPETLVITELRRGPTFRAEICLMDGGRYALERAELSADRLAPILATLGARVDRVDIRVPNPVLDGLCLVDTPGTGDLFERFDARVARYLREADLVLILVSPISPLSTSETTFLRSAVAPRDFSKILCVLNMIDLARDPGELKRLAALLRRRLHDVLPMAELFPVSALDEFRRHMGGARLNPALGELPARGFDALRAALTEAATISREAIQLDRASHLLAALLDRFDCRIERIQTTLSTDHRQMEMTIDSAEKDLTALETRRSDQQCVIRETVSRLATETVGWMQGFVDRIEREVAPQLAEQSSEAVRQHLVLFLADRLRQAFDACLRAHQPALGSLLVTTIPDGESGSPQILATSTWMLALRPTITPGVGLLGLLSNLTEGLELPLVVFGNLVGVAERGTVKVDYLRQLQAALPDLRRAVTEMVERTYRSLADRLVADLDARLTTERESALAALRQARSLLIDQSHNQAEINSLLAHARAASTETRTVLAKLDRQLWEEEGLEKPSNSIQ